MLNNVAAGGATVRRLGRPKSYTDSPEWLRGYATALVRTLESSGITAAKLKAAGVDELDLKELAKCSVQAVAR